MSATRRPRLAAHFVYPAGPIYHGYAARYLIPFAAALATAVGDDAGLLDAPGVHRTARFQVRSMENPTPFRYFNWGDASEWQETLTMLLLPAARAGDGAAAWTLRRHLDLHPPPVSDIDGHEAALEYANALVYYTPMGAATDVTRLPLDAFYPAKKLALLRSNWTYDGAFVGIKGVNTTWSHGDLDGGTFTYSVGGVRFAADLGADNYGCVSRSGRGGGGRRERTRPTRRKFTELTSAAQPLRLPRTTTTLTQP